MHQRILRLLFIFLLVFVIDSRSENVDSLWSVYRNTKNHDSIRFQAFNDIAWSFLYTNPDSTYLLGLEELERAREKKLKNWESKALNTIGASFQMRGDYLSAVEYYQQSLRIREQMGDKAGASASLANIGSIYISLGEFDKALTYQLRCLTIFEEMENKQAMASTFNNLGIIYNNKADYTKALEYNQKSLKIYKELGDQQGVAASNANIGNIYSSLADYDKAMEYQLTSLSIAQQMGDKPAISTNMSSIGKCCMKQKRYGLALSYLEKAKKIALEIEDQPSEKEAVSVLYETYKEMKNPGKALENYERYIVLRDSIFQEDSKRELTRKELQYEYDKKMASDSVKHAEDRKVKDALIFAKNAQIEQDKTQKTALFGGVLLLLVSGGVMYNRFRIIRKQKQIIETKNKETEEQKLIIEQKQTEILASISYAKRLQEAILPPQSLIHQELQDSFILYKPKDIVAGDFYWLERINNRVLFAAADCTGHGVPGAMVSMVCSNAMNRTVKEFGLEDPGAILDNVLELVAETFERSETEVKDGMDISLCSLNRETKELKWSGANNPLWIVRGTEFIELKPNKQSIGKIDDPIPYTTEIIQLQANDMIYVFTDGYADQFGGEKGKKFKYAQLQDLLIRNAQRKLEDQMEALNSALKIWKGNLEQVDDILIMGIRI